MGLGGSPYIYTWGGPLYIYMGGPWGSPPSIYTWGYRHACSTGVLGVRWCNTLIHPRWGGVPPCIYRGAPLHIHIPQSYSTQGIYTWGGSPSIYTWGVRGVPPLYIHGGPWGSPPIYIWGGPPSIYTWGVPGGSPSIYTWGYRHACSTGVLRVRWCNTLIQGGGTPGGVPSLYIWGGEGGSPLYIYMGVPSSL